MTMTPEQFNDFLVAKINELFAIIYFSFALLFIVLLLYLAFLFFAVRKLRRWS